MSSPGVGLEAGHLEKVAEFYNSVGFCDELSHIYLALDLHESPWRRSVSRKST